MKLDTIFDGTVYCSLVIEERGEETTASMGNKIKYFFDKEMNSLPLREETFIYDKVKRKVYDHYIWENLEARAEIRIYPFDEENITIGESKNKLELQCWLNIK